MSFSVLPLAPPFCLLASWAHQPPWTPRPVFLLFQVPQAARMLSSPRMRHSLGISHFLFGSSCRSRFRSVLCFRLVSVSFWLWSTAHRYVPGFVVSVGVSAPQVNIVAPQDQSLLCRSPPFSFVCDLRQWRCGACRIDYNTDSARLSVAQKKSKEKRVPNQFDINPPMHAAWPVFAHVGTFRPGGSHSKSSRFQQLSSSLWSSPLPHSCCLDRLLRSNDPPATLMEVRVRCASLVALHWWCGELSTTGHRSPYHCPAGMLQQFLHCVSWVCKTT